MKRWPLVASFLLFITLCASLAYWALQLFKPPLRPVAAPPRMEKADVRPEAAAALFGGKTGNVAVASNYQLKGVIFSGRARDSVAILSADGKPAQAVLVGKEAMPGVTVREVYRDYVLLSEGGAIKRVELPESAKGQDNVAVTAPMPARPVAVPAPIRSVPERAPPPAPPTIRAAPPTVVISPPPSTVQPPAPAVQLPAPAVQPPAAAPQTPPATPVAPAVAPQAPGTATPSPAPSTTVPSAPATTTPPATPPAPQLRPGSVPVPGAPLPNR